MTVSTHTSLNTSIVKKALGTEDVIVWGTYLVEKAAGQSQQSNPQGDEATQTALKVPILTLTRR